MVSPEVLTDGSLNHSHADNAARNTADSNTQVDNSDSSIRNEESVKQPSYLNIACCISGYTTLTTYNSKQREGFRSRDISPARISPYAADDGRNPAVFTSVCGNLLSPHPRYLTEMDHRKKSGDKLWNGNGTASQTSDSTLTSSTTCSGNSSFLHCQSRTQHHSTTSDSVASQSTQASSFIVQRVERLYGPGALAQGFYTRRSLNPPHAQEQEPDELLKEASKESALPVLRLLRPEFRAQLTLAKRKSSSPVCSPSRASDSTDGAVTRIIPITVEPSEINNSKVVEERETINKAANKDGHFYLKMVDIETEELERLASNLEAELLSGSVPDSMEGRLRAAAGKARLLATQKLGQFKGLCHKNINQDPREDFPTTFEDLAGFWDMVSIQVTQVHQEFDQLHVLREAGWREQDTEAVKKGAMSNGSGGSRKVKPVCKPPTVKSTASKARDEARKKMLAELRKGKGSNSNTSEDIVIV